MLNDASDISLDEVVNNPSLAHDLAPATIAVLLGRAHIAIAALEARLLVVSIDRTEPVRAVPGLTRLMTAEEVSERLGFKPGYVYELARAGKIKSLQQGKYVRFTETALSEYIGGKGSAVEHKLNNVLSAVHEPRAVPRCAPRHRPHANGNSAAARRTSDDD